MSTLGAGERWLRLIKMEEVRDEDALMLLFSLNTMGAFIVCYMWPQLPQAILGRVASGVVSVATARYTKYVVICTLLAVIIGITGSTLTRSYNHAPTLYSKLAPTKKEGGSLVDLLRPDQSAEQLIDACNDLDYAFQVMAVAGATPYVVPVRVMPEFTWKRIIVPLARRVFYHGWNLFVRTVQFVDLCCSHVTERITVVYELALRLGKWFVNTIVAPILRFVATVADLIGSFVSAIVTAVTNMISRLISTLISIITTIVKFVVNMCLVPLSNFVMSSFTWLSQLVSNIVTHLVTTIQRLFA